MQRVLRSANLDYTDAIDGAGAPVGQVLGGVFILPTDRPALAASQCRPRERRSPSTGTALPATASSRCATAAALLNSSRAYPFRVDAGNWITLAGVVITGGSTIWAVISAKRAAAARSEAAHHQVRAEQNAERATQAAEEAAAWQRQTATAAQQVAEAIAEQNRRADEDAELAEGVPWRITFRTGSTYDLWNDSDRPKFGVHIFGEGVLREKTVDRIDGRSSEDFMALHASGKGSRVKIVWHRREDRADEPRQWSGNRPPRL